MDQSSEEETFPKTSDISLTQGTQPRPHYKHSHDVDPGCSRESQYKRTDSHALRDQLSASLIFHNYARFRGHDQRNVELTEEDVRRRKSRRDDDDGDDDEAAAAAADSAPQELRWEENATASGTSRQGKVFLEPSPSAPVSRCHVLLQNTEAPRSKFSKWFRNSFELPHPRHKNDGAKANGQKDCNGAAVAAVAAAGAAVHRHEKNERKEKRGKRKMRLAALGILSVCQDGLINKRLLSKTMTESKYTTQSWSQQNNIDEKNGNVLDVGPQRIKIYTRQQVAWLTVEIEEDSSDEHEDNNKKDQEESGERERKVELRRVGWEAAEECHLRQSCPPAELLTRLCPLLRAATRSRQINAFSGRVVFELLKDSQARSLAWTALTLEEEQETKDITWVIVQDTCAMLSRSFPKRNHGRSVIRKRLVNSEFREKNHVKSVWLPSLHATVCTKREAENRVEKYKTQKYKGSPNPLGTARSLGGMRVLPENYKRHSENCGVFRGLELLFLQLARHKANQYRCSDTKKKKTILGPCQTLPGNSTNVLFESGLTGSDSDSMNVSQFWRGVPLAERTVVAKGKQKKILFGVTTTIVLQNNQRFNWHKLVQPRCLKRVLNRELKISEPLLTQTVAYCVYSIATRLNNDEELTARDSAYVEIAAKWTRIMPTGRSIGRIERPGHVTSRGSNSVEPNNSHPTLLPNLPPAHSYPELVNQGEVLPQEFPLVPEKFMDDKYDCFTNLPKTEKERPFTFPSELITDAARFQRLTLKI
ncbi:hypothetical protein WN51_01366 [Melipona quadrifasciata]|uniref:Uncharacterized protein n=1 Tax=Melipona quadrifasciata TaxID=166423 RepID=A0A0N0BFF4_9HYME|nr:hypothetical protein WN51_01366 [Melipona quadrifasciata]